MFYGVFAVTVTSSVQLIGVYLVFASLIIPALAVRKLNNKGLIYGFVTGTLAYALGLSLSAILDWPSGATIVWALALAGLIMASLLKGLEGNTASLSKYYYEIKLIEQISG